MSDFYCDEVLSGKTTVEHVFESDNVLAFYHTKPFWPVHIVVVPKKHIASLITVTKEEEPILRELLETIQRIAADMIEKHGSARVLTNLGEYQDSKHLHFHVCFGDPVR